MPGWWNDLAWIDDEPRLCFVCGESEHNYNCDISDPEEVDEG